ncbi:hypothetical protein BDQ17DRAFT_1328681 [Cyathus striatus]|nr:hypothetical protein BDQ17DRAFT_1328681 [Cyathus striatus]
MHHLVRVFLLTFIDTITAINQYPTIGNILMSLTYSSAAANITAGNVPKPTACGNSGILPAGGWIANKPCGYVMGSAVAGGAFDVEKTSSAGFHFGRYRRSDGNLCTWIIPSSLDLSEPVSVASSCSDTTQAALCNRQDFGVDFDSPPHQGDGAITVPLDLSYCSGQHISSGAFQDPVPFSLATSSNAGYRYSTKDLQASMVRATVAEYGQVLSEIGESNESGTLGNGRLFKLSLISKLATDSNVTNDDLSHPLTTPGKALKGIIETAHKHGCYVSTGGYIERMLSSSGGNQSVIERYLETCKNVGWLLCIGNILRLSINSDEDWDLWLNMLLLISTYVFRWGAGGDASIEKLESAGTRDPKWLIDRENVFLQAGAHVVMIESEGITENITVKLFIDLPEKGIWGTGSTFGRIVAFEGSHSGKKDEK